MRDDERLFVGDAGMIVAAGATQKLVESFAAGDSILSPITASDLDALPAIAGALSIEEVAGNRFALGLPQVSADGALLKIVFDAAVFRYGTRFQGRAFADANTAIPLQTEGGNATADLQTDELLVRVTVGSQVAGALSVVPQLFTPNGDGINDAVQISYTVLHLLEPSPAAVRVYDLAGRVVRVREDLV